MADHEEGDEQEAEQLLLLAEHADVAEAIAAEVEHVAIDVPATHVNVVSVEEGEPIAVAVAPDALHDSTAIHVSVDAAGFGNGSSNHRDANVSAFLLHSILEGNWAAVIERCKTHPEEIRYADKRTRRTPLHEACGARPRSSIINRVPAEVIYAILDAAENDANDLASKLDINGNSPLQLACRDVKLWRKDPSSTSSGSDTTAQSALQVAEGQTLEQWQGVIERLINVCPETAGWSNKGHLTPLMDTCEHEFVPPEIIQLLLSVDEKVAYVCDKTGKSALAKYGESSGKSLAVARLLLDACPASLLYRDSDGCTPLHRPSFELNVNLVESMLLRDESVASIADNKGLLPLHRACQRSKNTNENGVFSRLEVIRLLLDAYPEGCMETNDKGMAPIHFASARNPNLDIIQSICETQPDCLVLQDKLGWTALHHTCSLPDCGEIVAYLLEVNPGLAKIKTKKEDTALHKAASANTSTQVVQNLVDLYPPAILERNDYGFTPLHVLCRAEQPSVDLIRIIGDANQDVLNMTTNANEFPINLVCLRPRVSIDAVRYFLEKSDVEMSFANPKTGNTPLHDACLRGLSSEVIEFIAEERPSWAIATNTQMQTPLHLVCKVMAATTDIRVVQTLVRIGGPNQIGNPDIHYFTPLVSALRPDTSLELITFLLDDCPDAIHYRSGYTLEMAICREVPTNVLSEVAKASGAARILRARNTGAAAPIEVIMEMTYNADLHSEEMDEFERLHRAFLLLSIAVGKNGRGESFRNGRGVSTSLTLVDLFTARRRYGAKAVGWKLIHFLLKKCTESPRDEDGNTLVHIEAGVREVARHADRLHLYCPLQMLLRKFPDDIRVNNNVGELPFDLMIKTNRHWLSGTATLISRYPQALTAWLERQESPEVLLPNLLRKVTHYCGIATTLQLLQSLPKFADYHN